MKRPILASVIIMASLFSQPSFADDMADLAKIRSQLNALDREYRAKIANLEARLKKAEAEATTARAAATSAVERASVAATSAQTAQAAAQQVAAAAPQTPTAAASPPTSMNAFNPGIAAVLNGFYAASSRNPDRQRIVGFANGDEARTLPNGFSLGESEISFAANIDTELAGFLDVSFDRDSQPDVEEAYIRTTNLGAGFTVKAGRFLSGIAYLNERHAHDWNFSDAPLPYRAFLNSQYGDDGVQVRWIAPINLFLEFGAEWFRGDSYPAGNGHGGQGTITAFAHTGSDINDSSSWLAAVSYVHTNARNRETDNANLSGTDHFTGNDDIGIFSLVYKWAPGGNPIVQNLILNGEFFFGREKGLFDGIPVNQVRSGWYAQGVYQFMPRWNLGLRYAELRGDDVPAALSGSALDDFGHTPRAETALLEYDTSEFGRIRIQYTHDQSDLKPDDEVFLQYTVIFGPHGAHRY